MIKTALRLSHLFDRPFKEGRRLMEQVDVLEFRQPKKPADLPAKPMTYHSGDGLVLENFLGDFQDQNLAGFLREIDARLFSFDLGPACRRHIGVLPFGPTLSPEEIKAETARALEQVRRQFSGPLAVENYGYYPTGMYDHICRPDFIRDTLKEFDLGLVLDLAHAMVSAINTGDDVWDYILSLPLERVMEIHVSRPYIRPDLAVDAHLEPGDKEFELLGFVLDRLNPADEVHVVIEHYDSLAAVARSYKRLESLIAAKKSGRPSDASTTHLAPRPLRPEERLRRKNAFDAGLVMGVEKFTRQTGRDRHRQNRWDELVDPETGLVRAELIRARPCPVCSRNGGDPGEALFVKQGFRHLRCPDCGLIYVNPVLKDEAVLEHYQEESSWVQVLASEPQVELDRMKYEYGLDVAAPHLAGPDLLDVGAGTGLFVETAAGRGFRPAALELHRQNAANLRERGFEVIDRPLEQAGLDEDRFDLVTLWEVLEHIVDPGSLLNEISRVLRPGGILLILVPNADSLASRLLHEKSGAFGGHSHVNFFNVNTLTRLLGQTGFEAIDRETIISELGTINNYLNFEDPYLGRASATLDLLTPRAIHQRLLGSKLLMLVQNTKGRNTEQ